MTDILSAVVSALHADQKRLEQVSLNAANATTPGYKRGVVSSVSFDAVLQGAAQAGSSGIVPSTTPSSLPLLRHSVDLTAASLQATGRPLDVAIEGEGMLVLSDGDQQWLTRSGALQVNAQGDLIGARGLKVQGLQGDIRITKPAEVSIDSTGRVLQGTQQLGQLRLVKPSDPRSLETTDGVLFQASADDELSNLPTDLYTTRAGFLESSNANGLNDMLGVMETVRHFESLIRLAQGYDDVMGKAIQKLAEA